MKRKIRLLVITHSYPTKYNPIATTFISNQVEGLKKYCQIKVLFPYLYSPKIRLFNPYYKYSRMPEIEKVNNIAVYHPKYFMFPRILFVPKFLNFFLFIESMFSYLASKKLADTIVEEWNPDIIYIHGLLADGLIGLRLKRKYNKPLLVNVWGEDVTKFSKEMFSKSLAKLTLKNSDAIISQSSFLKNEINRVGLTKKKFFIITTGALLSNFKAKNKFKSREILNLPKNKKIILFVGHLIPRKGVKYLIRAIKLLLKRDKNVLCCIIGKGNTENSLKKLTVELNLENYVKFLGEKNSKEVAKYMNACDIFVLPSLNEGLPVVLCEALACGKPVVATKVAGTPELVNKDVGYLVRPKDANDLAEKILLALNKKWNKEKLLKRAREFSVTNSVKKLMGVYESFLKGAATRNLL